MSKKQEKTLIKGLVFSILENAVVCGDISIKELENYTEEDIINLVIDSLNINCNESDELNCTIIYTNTLIKEADKLNEKGYYHLALIFYATAIEHMLNEIIQKALYRKNLTIGEIKNIMRLDIESKRTWLLPIIGLPRLSKNSTNGIKEIFDYRNKFIHYKWQGQYDSEQNAENHKYLILCKKAKTVIKAINKYITDNLISRSKIKNILNDDINKKTDKIWQKIFGVV